MAEDKPACDFCYGLPAWRYPAETFTEFQESILPQQSIGDWLACDECASLIERNEWEKLARRGLLNPDVAAAVEAVGEEAMLVDIRRFQKKLSPASARTGALRATGPLSRASGVLS